MLSSFTTCGAGRRIPEGKGRRRLAGALLAGTLMLVPATAMAQTRFTSLTAFGDSYMDHGINLLALSRGITSNYPSPGGSVPALQAANPGGWIAYPYHVQALLGLSDAQVRNYAIAGATTTPFNTNGSTLSLPTELAAWNGRAFGPSDLVLINIGGNDAIGGARLGLNPITLGTQVASTAVAAVNRFVGAGARNVVFTGFSNMSFLPIVRAAGAGAYTDVLGAAYYATLQAQMRPLALAGARIFLVDQSILGARVAANPGAYGFESFAYAGPGRLSMFQPDGLHLSTQGYALASRYIANIVNAPSTYAAQGEATQITTTAFARSIFGQLDGARSAGFGPAAGVHGSPLSIHVAVTGQTGTRDNRPDALGLKYDAVGGQIGAEYRIDPSLKVGALFNYTSGRFDLRGSGGKVEQDAYQFGAYASYANGPWFADVMGIYGRGDLKIDRIGVIDKIRGSTNSDSFAVGGRTAYLFSLSPWLQAGPLAGLTYVNSQLGSYTERGDPVLTYAVGRQTVESLIGSAGAQFRFPLAVGGLTLSPYVNVTAEQDFLGSRRTILATLTQSPLLPISTPVTGRGGSTYGAVQAGISAPITARTSIAINVATTFARRDGNDLGGNIVLRHSF